MEIPFLSGIIKRYRRRKQFKLLRNERMRLINRTVALGYTFDTVAGRFLCPCCSQRICGRKVNRSKVGGLINAQKELDQIDEAIRLWS